MKQGQPNVPTITKFLSEMATNYYNDQQSTNGEEGGGEAKKKKVLRVGLDPYVHSASFAKELNEALANAAGEVLANGNDGEELREIAVIDTLDGKPNLVDAIWEGRPALPKNPFRVQVGSRLRILMHHLVQLWLCLHFASHTHTPIPHISQWNTLESQSSTR